jgi:hypothetical protein
MSRPGIEPRAPWLEASTLEKEPLWEDPMICKGDNWRLKCMKKDTEREAGIIEF